MIIENMDEEEKQVCSLTEKFTLETKTVSAECDVKEREQWDKKIEYMLSMLGYIVGLGNFWRFPYLCMRNGGGAFLIPFAVCLIFIAFPIFFLEVALGQFTARSIMHCWEACPIFKGIGVGMVIMNFICSLYYVMVITWTLYYLYNSFVSPLPWTTCENEWNTENCTENGNWKKVLQENVNRMNMSSLYNETLFSNQSMTLSNKTIDKDLIETFQNTNLSEKVSSQEEFWQYNVLDMSTGIEDMGHLNVNVFICLLVSWIMIYLCIMKGVKSIGKVVYVTATLPYIIMAILLVQGCTLPGSVDGILYYITPNFSRITESKVWIEAAIQVFYSTCVCWGPLITMASYNKFHVNCMRDAALLLTLGEGFSVFGGFVVFSVLGFMAHSNGVGVEDIVKSGPGLIYVAYPEVVSKLPLPNLWAVLFFVMVLTIGLDSQFATCEPLISVFCDSSQFFRKRRLTFTGVIMAISFLLGLPLCFQGGIYVFQLLDWYIAAFCIPVFGIIECVVFGWIYGAEMFSRDVQLMIGRPIPIFIRILWCFITPNLLLVLLISIITNYEPPTYGKYEYPAILNVLGLLYALAPLVPLFYFAIGEVYKAEGYSLQEKLRNSMKPSLLWKPGDREAQKGYIDNIKEYPRWPTRMRWTIIGR